jgi:hypothetical protein
MQSNVLLPPPNEQTSDHAKMIYLQNAVYAMEELRLVQTTRSQLALAHGAVPTNKDYEALLKSAASTYDRAHAPAKHQPTRSAERTTIFGMPTSLNPFTKHMNSDLILTLLLTLCKHIWVTSWG